jgi:hypothetical protein
MKQDFLRLNGMGTVIWILFNFYSTNPNIRRYYTYGQFYYTFNVINAPGIYILFTQICFTEARKEFDNFKNPLKT